MMTPDDSKPVTAATNRKGSKAGRNKATAVVTSVNRSTRDSEDLFIDSNDETDHVSEYSKLNRPPRLSTDAFMDDDDLGFSPRKRALPTQSTKALTRPKGKGKDKLLVSGTPEPDDTEKRPGNLSLEERCYQELLNARREVSPISATLDMLTTILVGR